jgi:hypothetical protein
MPLEAIPTLTWWMCKIVRWEQQTKRCERVSVKLLQREAEIHFSFLVPLFMFLKLQSKAEQV